MATESESNELDQPVYEDDGCLSDSSSLDNASLEVNIGDEGSCQASDVSSLSFQSALWDDDVVYKEWGDTSNRGDSHESSDIDSTLDDIDDPPFGVHLDGGIGGANYDSVTDTATMKRRSGVLTATDANADCVHNTVSDLLEKMSTNTADSLNKVTKVTRSASVTNSPAITATNTVAVTNLVTNTISDPCTNIAETVASTNCCDPCVTNTVRSSNANDDGAREVISSNNASTGDKAADLSSDALLGDEITFEDPADYIPCLLPSKPPSRSFTKTVFKCSGRVVTKKPINKVLKPTNKSGGGVTEKIACTTSLPTSTRVIYVDKHGSRSAHDLQASSSEEVDPAKVIRKRNSLEIRNNISTVGVMSVCDGRGDHEVVGDGGVLPMVKMSPGLARRIPEEQVAEFMGRDSSSPEHDGSGDSSMAMTNGLASGVVDDVVEPDTSVVSGQTDYDSDRLLSYLPCQRSPPPERRASPPIDDTLSSSQPEYTVLPDNNVSPLHDDTSESHVTSDVTTSPDTVRSHPISIPIPTDDALSVENEYDYAKYVRRVQSVEDDGAYIGRRLAGASPVNDDMMTEISLVTEVTTQDDDDDSFLSVTADGMPQLEDGLSSEQTSDADTSTRDELTDGQLDMRMDAIDSAIRDIQLAVRQRNDCQPMKDRVASVDETDAEPVWVKRNNYTDKVHHLDKLRQAHGAHALQSDELSREQEHVYKLEEEGDKLLSCQYTRNDGEEYRSPKGFDSDDELPGPSSPPPTVTTGARQQQRRMGSGGRYSSLPADDPADYAYFKAVSDRYPGEVNPLSNGHYGNDVVQRKSPAVECAKVNTHVRQVDHHEDDDDDDDDDQGEYDTDNEHEDLLEKQYGGETSGSNEDDKLDIPELSQSPVHRNNAKAESRRARTREVLTLRDPDDESVLIEGVLFRARYLGSTQLVSSGRPSKSMRMVQAQEAVGRIKTLGRMHFGDNFQAPEGESQPSTEVDLFVSSEKVMILNTDLQEIMMDHALRTISYIADIGDILVIMARRAPIVTTADDPDDLLNQKRQAKVCCHVFETEEAQLIAQSIGQAFQVAYMEFLKANGIDDPTLMKEIDYQEVLNQQEIFGEELHLFSNREMQKEVIVPKLKGECIGVVIVESGWGSMVPTVVLANMCPQGAAARCGQLNIGDQIMSLNGISLVGLPLSSCKNYIKDARNQTVIKLTVVSCPPVVEVLVKRPDVKYQLGFSVQNGVICSLLRGGIAERGGVRVGHRIIEINSQSVVAVPHERIVNVLATSVGEIHMKTMPTSIFRLLTGQDTPHYI